jgi:hypothetical protein
MISILEFLVGFFFPDNFIVAFFHVGNNLSTLDQKFLESFLGLFQSGDLVFVLRVDFF